MAALLSASLHNDQRYSSPSGKLCKYSGQSVRAIPIRILTVGRKRSPGVQLVVDEYIGKLKLYCIVEDVQVRSNPRNAREPRTQVDDEDMAVMNHIKPTDWVVMLDERGKELGSEKMAELVGDAGNLGAWNRLIFCIGGAYGHGQQLRERANTTVKLSSMVLNHQIALLVLMEQLYRSWTILKDSRNSLSRNSMNLIENLYQMEVDRIKFMKQAHTYDAQGEFVVYRLPQLRILYT